MKYISFYSRDDLALTKEEFNNTSFIAHKLSFLFNVPVSVISNDQLSSLADIQAYRTSYRAPRYLISDFNYIDQCETLAVVRWRSLRYRVLIITLVFDWFCPIKLISSVSKWIKASDPRHTKHYALPTLYGSIQISWRSIWQSSSLVHPNIDELI